MIPKVTGFTDLKLLASVNDWRSTNLAEGYVGHPFGKCAYVKAMPHWAALADLPSILRGQQNQLGWWGSFRVPIHPQAVNVELKDGYMKFTKNTDITADMRWQYHCYSVAASPRWAVMERRLEAGETFLSRREFEALFPQASIGPPTSESADTMPATAKAWRLYSGIGNNLEALVAASVKDRAALLETIVRGSVADDFYTWFIALDENHWFPLIYEIRVLKSSTAVQFECSYTGTYPPEYNKSYYP